MKDYTEEAKRFYRSKLWARTRAAYIQSSGGLCERCLKAGLYNPGVVVHHKIHLDGAGLHDPDVALNFSNLELLCQDCHNREHHSSRPARRYTYDSEGNIIKK